MSAQPQPSAAATPSQTWSAISTTSTPSTPQAPPTTATPSTPQAPPPTSQAQAPSTASKSPTPPAHTPALDWTALERAVRGWLGRRAPATLIDDLTQETLLRVHRTLPADVRSPQAWALRSAHSTLVDHLRSAGRRLDAATEPEVLAALVPLHELDPTDRPDAGLDAAADRALDIAVARCLGRSIEALPTEQREALDLVGAQGLTSAQAAERAGVSVPGLKSRVQRGRAAVIEQTGQCCHIERDGRGHPIAITPREGEVCRCGCADAG